MNFSSNPIIDPENASALVVYAYCTSNIRDYYSNIIKLGYSEAISLGAVIISKIDLYNFITSCDMILSVIIIIFYFWSID